MAIEIKAKMIENNMEEFLKYWESNMTILTKVNKDMIDNAWFILYNYRRSGGSCASCLLNCYHMLETVYEANKPKIIVETIIEKKKKK